MPLKRNKKLAVVQRRLRVGDLYLQNFSQTAIAEELGVAQSTISEDLRAIEREWRESTIRDFELSRRIELRKLERIEREAWLGWDRSQKPAQSADIPGDGVQPSRKRVRNQYGDPRFLDQIHKCIAGRRALLGLDAPTKIAPTTPDGQSLYHDPLLLELDQLSEADLKVLEAALEVSKRFELEKPHE
ncbi:MAG: hypothetical protein AB7E74_26435 [Pirellulales bacterium]